MSKRAVVVHAVLAVACLAFAWWRAHIVEEKTGGPQSVLLFDGKPGTVTAVKYTWDKGSVTVTSQGEADARNVVVDLTRQIEPKTPPKKKDADAADAGPAESEPEAPPPVVETARFPGGKPVLTALEQLEPLKSRRTLGAVDDAGLDAMGLKAPLRRLTATVAGQTLDLDIGESAYGGNGRYARVSGDPRVHLLETSLITGLEGSPDALMEKRVVRGDVEQMTALEVKRGESALAFDHVDREQTAKRRLVLRGEDREGPGVAAAQQLSTTLRGLRAVRYSSDETVLGAEVVRFAVVSGAGVEAIAVHERVDGNGFLAKVGAGATAAWAELSLTQGKELLEDVNALFAE
jgi:hypothetical protein